MRRLQPYAVTSELQRGQLGTWRDQIAALDAEYLQTGKELNAAFEPFCYPPPSSPSAPKSWAAKPPGCFEKYRFLRDVWDPLITSWEKYRLNHEAWYDAPWTGTDVKAYRDRLKAFRDRARASGFFFAGPEPVAPPDSGVAATVGRIVKAAVIGGAIIGGVFILYKVLPPGERSAGAFPRT